MELDLLSTSNDFLISFLSGVLSHVSRFCDLNFSTVFLQTKLCCYLVNAPHESYLANGGVYLTGGDPRALQLV